MLNVSPILRTMPTIWRPIGPAISIAPSKMNSRTFLPTAIAKAMTRLAGGRKMPAIFSIRPIGSSRSATLKASQALRKSSLIFSQVRSSFVISALSQATVFSMVFAFSRFS